MESTHIGFPMETVTVFVILAIGAIFIDLFMHQGDKPVSLKNAAIWSVFWVAVAMGFAGFSISTTVRKLRACSSPAMRLRKCCRSTTCL